MCDQFFPVSSERHWTAQPERLHSAEVSDEQVGIQQLQLGCKLTPPVGAHPYTVNRSLKKWGLSLLPQSPHINSLFPLHRFPPQSLGSALLQLCLWSEVLCSENSTVAICVVGGRDRGVKRDGRRKLNGCRNTSIRGEIFSLGNLHHVNPTPPHPFFFHLYVP